MADSQEETEYLRSTEAYDPMHKQWQHRASMKVPRSFVSVCAVGAYIYAIGRRMFCVPWHFLGFDLNFDIGCSLKLDYFKVEMCV